MYPPPPPPQPAKRPRWLLPAGLGCGGLLFAFIVLAIIGTILGPPTEETAATKNPAASAPTSTRQPATPTPSPTVSTPAPAAPPPSAPPPTPSIRAIPSPDASEQATYLAALRKIDPGLTVNTERVMRRAGRICERIIQPPGGNLTLEQYTVLELSGGNATINEAQAKQVIKAVNAWCH